MVRWLTFTTIWLTVIVAAAFAGCLYYPSAETVVGYSAVGTGVGFCVAAGFLVLSAIRSRGLKLGWAVLWLFIGVLVSPVFSVAVVQLARFFTRPRRGDPLTALRLFWGESGIWELTAPILVLEVCVFVFFVRLLFAFVIRRRRYNNCDA